jgi:hypothetical protein
MLKRLQAVVVAMALGSAALIAAPAANAATAQISNVEINPNPVVVESSAKVTAKFSFVTDVSDAGKVSASLGPKGESSVGVPLTKEDAGSGKWKYKGSFDFGRKDPAGIWVFTAKADTATQSSEFKVVQVWDTDIAGFGAAPEPIKAGEVLTLSGKLLIDGPKGWHRYEGQKVFISIKEAGTSSYKRVAYDYTNWKGEFAVGLKAWKTGWWRAEYDGSAVAHHSVSDADQVDVLSKPKPPPSHDPEPSSESRIIRFNASPEPVKYGKYLRFTGKLQVWDGGWDGYGDTKVSLWFRTKHGSWKYVKTTWTNDSGKIRTKAKAWKSGYWKVVFAGNDDADSSSSVRDWVRVKYRH